VTRLLILVVLLGGCGDPPFALKFRLTRGDSQQCVADTGVVATSCQDVSLLCQAYLSIRVFEPSDPAAPYISMCVPIMDRNNTLCSISTPNLEVPDMDVEAQTLEVQMAVFPEGAIMTDPETGEPVCPQVEYGANGLPEATVQPCNEAEPFSCRRVPALGGRAYYQPGDAETIVDLGCTDLAQLTDPEVCTGISRIDVTATVNDLDNLVSSVDKSVADALSLSVGEPKPVADSFVLSANDTGDLAQTSATPPAWGATLLGIDITSTACVAVREDGAQTTTSLRCYPAAMKEVLDLAGVYVRKATLAQVLGAPGLPAFPDEGLTIGLVVDEHFEPLPAQPVACNGCTVKYLNAARTGVVTGATSASGIFVSQDATYGTPFSIVSPDASASTGIGGLVEGKVTVVVLQYKDLKPN